MCSALRHARLLCLKLTGRAITPSVAWITQNVATTPDGLDIVLAIAGGCEFPAQFANKHVNNLYLGLVHAAVEVMQDHLLGQRNVLTQG